MGEGNTIPRASTVFGDARPTCCQADSAARLAKMANQMYSKARSFISIQSFTFQSVCHRGPPAAFKRGSLFSIARRASDACFGNCGRSPPTFRTSDGIRWHSAPAERATLTQKGAPQERRSRPPFAAWIPTAFRSSFEAAAGQRHVARATPSAELGQF